MQTNKQFEINDVKIAMTQNFPNCPQNDTEAIIKIVLERHWTKNTKLVTAISLTAHNYIRHNLTDYDMLLNVKKLDREKARIKVKQELDDIFEYWHSGYDIYKPEKFRT